MKALIIDMGRMEIDSQVEVFFHEINDSGVLVLAATYQRAAEVFEAENPGTWAGTVARVDPPFEKIALRHAGHTVEIGPHGEDRR